MFLNKLFSYLSALISKCKSCFNVESSTYYFHVKKMTLADFEICISLPLIMSIVNILKTSYFHMTLYAYLRNNINFPKIASSFSAIISFPKNGPQRDEIPK